MTSRAWLLLLPATLFLLLGFVLPIALLAATSLGGVGGGLGSSSTGASCSTRSIASS